MAPIPVCEHVDQYIETNPGQNELDIRTGHLFFERVSIKQRHEAVMIE